MRYLNKKLSNPSRLGDFPAHSDQTPSAVALQERTTDSAVPDDGLHFSGADKGHAEMELSVVIPCLNEADTLAECLEKALRAIQEHHIVGEVVVADNGSTDGSIEIAKRLGARLVHVPARGYGNALMGGIAASRGKYIIMGDADGSYDFKQIPQFVQKLREGYDLVQGCRLRSGGGTVMPGAMPVLHKWLGNPLFSLMARRWFKSRLHDVHCGLRGFTKAHYQQIGQRCTGMEFATEMIIKSSLFGGKAAEIPITLYPDGRKAHGPHLKTFSDGWRHLRFYLICSPRWLFLIPGVILIELGILAFMLALPQVTLRGVSFDVNTLLFGSLAVLCGYESIFFAIFAKMLGAREGILPEDSRISGFVKTFNLEVALLGAGFALLVGLGLLIVAMNEWRLADFGRLQYAHMVRIVIPGATLTALGFQTILSAFLLSILDLRRQ
jgi:glycosyltransferase involved in cell wall biosynthesis